MSPPPPAFAELPLSIENVLPAANSLKLDFGLSYSNSSNSGYSSTPVSVQVAPNQFIQLSGPISQQGLNNDLLNASLGLRYGLSAKSEIYGRVSGYASESRNFSSPNFSSTKQNGYSSTSFGLVQRLYQPSKVNSLIGFSSVNLVNQDIKLVDGASTKLTGRSYSLGLTGYHSTDPIVLSLSSGIALNTPQKISGQRITPGHGLQARGGVDFSVNDQVTLSGSVQWQRQQAQFSNGVQSSSSQTSTSASAGLGYAVSKSTTAFLSLNTEVSGKSGSTINFSWALSLN